MTSQEPQQSRDRPSILVVDDDHSVRESLRLALEGELQVKAVEDGRAALRHLAREPTDLVLLDILMPGMDGLQVLAELRVSRPQLPVIVLTDLDRAAPAVEAMRLGAQDCLTKPVDGQEVLLAVTSVLRRANLKRLSGRAMPASGMVPPSLASILLVGPDVAQLAGLKIALAPATTKLAPTAAALRYLENHRPGFVLLDGSMELEDLVVVARAVRHSVPKCSLAVGYAVDPGPRRLATLLAVQPDAVVGKPYDPNEVRSLAWEALPATEIPFGYASLSTPVVRAIDIVCRHYDTVTLAAAAEAGGVSPGYLAHLFREELKMTLWQCVITVRLEVVKNMLTQTSYKLEHIAKLTGFCDSPHLSRVFSQHCGCSPRCGPRAYRMRTVVPTIGGPYRANLSG